MQFRLLGSLEVTNDGRSLPLGGPKQRTVLAHLLLRANHVVATDRLIDQLWDGEPPEAARNSLQSYVSHLRKALGADRIEGRSPGYVLVAAPEELDALTFEALVKRARALLATAPGDAATALEEALQLWRGSPLADLADEPSLQGEIARLEEVRLGAIEDRIGADLVLGRHAEVVGELEGQVAAQPMRERLWGQLMLALYRSGRQADALAAYGRARRVLSEQLGIDPSPELVRLQERILAQDPELEVAAKDRPAPAVDTEIRNPYKGLRPFLEADAADFFGREVLTRRLLERMGERADHARFLAVVGPSGSGKSSVVRAGLVPALRAGALPGSQDWYVVEMIPGAYPFEELEAALLRVAVNPPPSLIEQLQWDELGVLRATKRVLPADGPELVLVIDQFEELFTLVADEARRARFLESLLVAVSDPRSRLRVIITLRADFFDRPLTYQGFGDLVASRTEAVTPLSTPELEQAISGPADRMGVGLEPLVVAEMVTEATDQPGGLPLLQYALTELFERRSGSMLTLEGYRAVGGVSGALARRAEESFDALDETAREAARQLFLRLITLGEDGVQDTRRRVLRVELAAIEIDANAMDAAVDTFGAARLLSFDRDPLTQGPTVEVAHEALLTRWDRLKRWIESAREDVRMHRRLVAGTAEWVGSGRDQSFLLRGSRLTQFASWAETATLALTDTERAYVRESASLQAQEQVRDAARKAREAFLERRSIRRLRAIVAVLTATALVASGLTVFAFDQRRASLRQARIAEARGLAGAAVINSAVDPDLGILLALQAVDHARQSKDATVLHETEDVLHRAIRAQRRLVTVNAGEDFETLFLVGGAVAFSPDGLTFATAGAQNTAVIWDARSGRKLVTLAGHAGPVTDVAFSPDGAHVATSSNDGTARLWDARTGTPLLTFRGHTAGVVTVAFSSDGRRLATAGWDGTARVWDATTGELQTTLRLRTGPAFDAQFSPDGSRLAVADRDGGVARVWDLATGREQMELHPRVHAGGVFAVAFSPDGTKLAMASEDETATIWDARTGKLIRLISPHAGVWGVAFSPDGTELAAPLQDGTVGLWDLMSGGAVPGLPPQFPNTAAEIVRGLRSLTQVAFSPDGTRLAAASNDGTTTIWDLAPDGSREAGLLSGVASDVNGIGYDGDGGRLAATLYSGPVQVWNTVTGNVVRTVEDPDHLFRGVAMSPDGTRVAATTGDGATVWDARTGATLLTLPHVNVTGVAFSPDGRLIATSGQYTALKVWDASTGRNLRSLVGLRRLAVSAGPEGGMNVAFSRDGRYVLTPEGDLGSVVWGVADGRLVAVLPPIGAIDGAFSPDGTDVILAPAQGPAQIWDWRTGRRKFVLAGQAGVNKVAYSPDGSLAATAGADQTTAVWDAHTGELLYSLPAGHNVWSVAFSPDGRLLATAEADGTVRMYALGVDDLESIARARLTRSLTSEECQRYLHVSVCPAGS